MTKANGKLTAVPGDPKRYGALLAQALPAIIETEEQNEQYLAIVEKLMRKGENLSPEEETLLKLLAHLIEDFERRYYKPRRATPVEVLRELMAANDLKNEGLRHRDQRLGDLVSRFRGGRRNGCRSQTALVAEDAARHAEAYGLHYGGACEASDCRCRSEGVLDDVGEHPRNPAPVDRQHDQAPEHLKYDHHRHYCAGDARDGMNASENDQSGGDGDNDACPELRDAEGLV